MTDEATEPGLDVPVRPGASPPVLAGAAAPIVTVPPPVGPSVRAALASPSTRQAFLKQLRARADPLAAGLAKGLIKSVEDFEREACPGAWPEGGKQLAPQPDLRAPWARDTSRIANGQAFFSDWSLLYGASLFVASLPACYASAKGAKALTEVSSALAARGDIRRRMAETGRFLVDVFSFDTVADGQALDPGARGQRSCNGVRTFHAYARELLCVDRDWDVAANGQPVNQEDLLGTILAFSVVAYRSMRRLGVRISLADVPVADNFYTWLVVGDLLGVDPSVLQQLDLGLAEELELAIRDDQYGCSEEGTRLAAHLLATLEDQMPIFFRKLPRTLIWHCTRPERVPQILGLPRPAWWGFVLRWVDVEAEGPLSRLSSWLTRAVTAKVGRLMFIGFIDANVDGDGRRWDVPEKMVAQLRLRSGRVARFTRRARRATRRKMRLAVPNRPVDSRRLDARLERQRR